MNQLNKEELLFKEDSLRKSVFNIQFEVVGQKN
jgi:hypothetical protein